MRAIRSGSGCDGLIRNLAVALVALGAGLALPVESASCKVYER